MRRTLLAAEAVVLLTGACALRLVVPMRWFDRALGVRADPSTAAAEGGDAQANDVRWALGAARRRLPWHVSCVPDALAGALMLRRRHVPYRVLIGVAKDDGLLAHAWLEAGGVTVTGGRTTTEYTPMSAYVG